MTEIPRVPENDQNDTETLKNFEISLKPIKWPKYLIKLKNNQNTPKPSTITGITLVL